MVESPLAKTPPANRLGIAHLLLWITTTAALFGCIRGAHIVSMERQRLSAAGMDEAEYGNQELPLVRSNRIVTLIGAPIYGMAVAGAALGLWHVATRRFLFPSQPGHWLLILIALVSFPLLVPLGLVPKSEFTGAVVAFSMRIGSAALSAALAAIAALHVPFLRWRIAFWLCAIGFGAQAIELLDLIAAPLGSMLGAMLALFVLSFAVPAAVVASVIDFTMPSRFDIFHWIGVATLFAALAHIILAPPLVDSMVLR
jgi:hypothetical protein